MFSYKVLNAAAIEMSKTMKVNGECYLSANSLLDRMAKSAKFKSRQEMKAVINKHFEAQSKELKVDFFEIGKEFIDYMVVSYSLLLTENTDFVVHLKKYPSTEEALEVYTDNYGIISFTEEEHALFGAEFTFAASNELNQLVTRKLNTEVTVSNFAASSYESINEMLREFANKQVLGLFSHAEPNVTEKTIEAFRAEGFKWSETVLEVVRDELEGFWATLME
ncbi:hypothetical protein [Vibrio crassostreae]|uniref:hypothetical protein n=1 Tax=Vibrio crassostreae TaxID=246167 RepID=UPI001B306773|nr:hypothetical protein [Vibrio crassostreae]